MKKLLKIFASFAIFMALAGSAMTFAMPSQTYAAGKCDPDFFFFPAWHRGLTYDTDCKIKPISDKKGDEKPANSVTLSVFIWTVVLNISDGLFRVAGLVSTGFIIWAGFQYMISTGNPEGIKKAKTTLTNAIVGLIISVLAISITNFAMGLIR